MLQMKEKDGKGRVGKSTRFMRGRSGNPSLGGPQAHALDWVITEWLTWLEENGWESFR